MSDRFEKCIEIEANRTRLYYNDKLGEPVMLLNKYAKKRG